MRLQLFVADGNPVCFSVKLEHYEFIGFVELENLSGLLDGIPRKVAQVRQTVHAAHAYESAEGSETQNLSVYDFANLYVVPEVVFFFFLFSFEQRSLTGYYLLFVVVNAVFQRNKSELFAYVLIQILYESVAYMGSGDENGVAPELGKQAALNSLVHSQIEFFTFLYAFNKLVILVKLFDFLSGKRQALVG